MFFFMELECQLRFPPGSRWARRSPHRRHLPPVSYFVKGTRGNLTQGKGYAILTRLCGIMAHFPRASRETAQGLRADPAGPLPLIRPDYPSRSLHGAPPPPNAVNVRLAKPRLLMTAAGAGQPIHADREGRRTNTAGNEEEASKMAQIH